MVLRKITCVMKSYHKRNCKYKGKHSYLKAFIKKIKLKMFKKEDVKIYKCPFENHYHIGHLNNNGRSRYKRKYVEKYAKLTLLCKI